MTNPVPTLSDADVQFGSIKHLPKWNDLPENMRRLWHREPWCDLASEWFSDGVKHDGEALVFKEARLTPKPGIDFNQAVRAIKAVLGSYEPSHEHKMAGVGFLFSQWFDRTETKAIGSPS